MSKYKIFLPAVCLSLLSAGCSLFGTSATYGVVKTVDGGGSWHLSNKVTNSKTTLAATVVNEIAFDPGNHQKIYLGSTNNGIISSNNSGDSWDQSLSKISVADFFIDPHDGRSIYAAGIFGGHGKIVHTANGGGSWDELYNEASADNLVSSITFNPANVKEIYASLSSGTIIKSTDGGINWFVVYDFKATVYKLRYNRPSNALYALLPDSGIFKSTDGAITWVSLTANLGLNGTATPDTGSTSILGTAQTGTAVGQYVKMGLDADAPGVIYVSAASGLFKTPDEGRTWQYLNVPLQSSQQTPRAIASTRAGMVAYVSFGSTIFKTLNGGQSWQTQELPVTANVNTIAIDPALPQVIYAGLTDQ